MDNKKIIEEITSRTFEVIKKVYYYQKENNPENRKNLSEVGSRILFPKYSEHRKSQETDRISEQELRFIFVEQLNKYADENNIDLYYSVETPTVDQYDFSKDSPEVSEDGVSARTDLSIHDKYFNRICLIEFKALNPATKNFEKDILKLQHASTELKYFIHIIKNYNRGTIDSLKEKTDKIKSTDIQYRCYCLDKGEVIDLKI